jgi:pectate lyase
MIKKLLLSLTFAIISNYIIAQTANITEFGGWLESAFVKWQPVTEAQSYNVYFTGEGITNQKIDTQLIRSYGSYFRADVLGLKAGTYTLSVVPVISGVEGTSSTTSSITVLAHDRNGFAFANTRNPGAYNPDGTPRANAVILYITENTKNTISLNVTGANANPCIGLQTILDGFKKGNDNRPLIVRLIGKITDLSYMLNGDVVIENNNNASSYITFEGVGEDAVAYGWGIRVKNASNIEIRNIGTMLTNEGEQDNIGLQQGNDYIWVHNVDFFYGDAGGAADQNKGDGALDCKKSTYVTFSYNHFWDSGKCNLLGLSENTTTGLYITYHHNWYDHSDSRHPRVRFYSAHVYNNYYDGNSKYGVGSTEGSSVFVENNFFRNCKYPMLTSMQGTDIFYGSPTFSSEDGGTIKAFNNTISGQNRFIPYDATNYPVEFDAYVANTRGEVISSSITSKQGTNSYNNFDTDPALYVKNIVVDSPEIAKDNVMLYSGRMFGGDFDWTFDNLVDDASSIVNAPLKDALVNYQSNIVFVQGDSTPDPEITLTATAGDAEVVLNWTTSNFSPTAFEVFRNTDSNPTGRVKIADITDPNILTYTDTALSNGTTYYYWVKADTTVESNIDSATPAEGSTASDEIHNFTISGTTSTFYSISGNLSTSKGTEVYNGLTLTQCLKIESATNISFTTVAESTLTLVFNNVFTGRINIDGANYNAVSGIVTLTIPSGSHTIVKTDTANLYYMSVQYGTLGIDDLKISKLLMYPNPVTNNLYLSTKAKIEKVKIYTLLGILVKTTEKNIENIDMSNMSQGTYLIKVFTNEGVLDKVVIKK